MSDAPHLLTEEDGAILIATLNRPEKLNALSGQMMELFEAALHRFRDTPALKVMLVRANGRYLLRRRRYAQRRWQRAATNGLGAFASDIA